MILPVIMAGGTGSRLWPLSEEHYPKQFLHLHGQGTMLQNTVSRLTGLPVSAPMVICGESHRALVAEQLCHGASSPVRILCEPAARNTAPAIALAALQCVTEVFDPVLLILPADHIIEDESAFREAVGNALPAAQKGKLVTFGIVPVRAETGYGYIERGDSAEQGADIFSVRRFVEKPDSMVAQSYVSSCRYYWNSGMFMFRASRYLEELQRFRPDILLACQRATEKTGHASSRALFPVNRECFMACPSESIDYAVMEKTRDAVVIPLDAGWNDIGSWDAVWDISDKDTSGNVISGNAFVHGSSGCYIRTDERRIAVIGADDLVVVSTGNAVLVVKKSQAQNVKYAITTSSGMKKG